MQNKNESNLDVNIIILERVNKQEIWHIWYTELQYNRVRNTVTWISRDAPELIVYSVQQYSLSILSSFRKRDTVSP